MIIRALALFTTAMVSFTVLSAVGVCAYAFAHANAGAYAREAALEEEGLVDEAEALVSEAEATEASVNTADAVETIEEIIDDIQEELLDSEESYPLQKSQPAGESSFNYGIGSGPDLFIYKHVFADEAEAAKGTDVLTEITEAFNESSDELVGVNTNTDYVESLPDLDKSTETVETAKSDKAPQPMTVKVKSLSVDSSKAAKKKLTIPNEKVFTIKHAKGEVTFEKKSGSKKITIAKDGRLTVAKGTKEGTYAIKVIVDAAGNAKYERGHETVTVKVEVKKKGASI